MIAMKHHIASALAGCGLFLLNAPLLTAQEPQNASDPLKGDRPIIAEMPQNARWLITLPQTQPKPKPLPPPPDAAGKSGKAAEDDGTAYEAQAAATLPDVFPVAIVVSKLGDNYHEAFKWSDGQESERWYFQGLALGHPTSVANRSGRSKGYKLGLAMRPGAARSELPVGIDPLDSYFRAAEKGPFPELSWLKKKDFKGEVTANGGKVLLFEGKETLVFDEGSTTYRTRAGIDAATRLPVFFEKDGLRRTYKFLPPPDPNMAPEGSFMKRIVQIRDQVHELTRMPSRP